MTVRNRPPKQTPAVRARRRDAEQYTYAQVEAALAMVHEIEDQALGAFRGRIKNFQRLGIVPRSPGKGKKILYSFVDAARWGLCMELAEFGMAPEYIKRIVMAIGDSVIAALYEPAEAEPQGENVDLILLLSPKVLSAEYNAEMIVNLSQIKPMPSCSDDIVRLLPRYLAINLSRFATRLGDELFRAQYGMG